MPYRVRKGFCVFCPPIVGACSLGCTSKRVVVPRVLMEVGFSNDRSGCGAVSTTLCCAGDLCRGMLRSPRVKTDETRPFYTGAFVCDCLVRLPLHIWVVSFFCHSADCSASACDAGRTARSNCIAVLLTSGIQLCFFFNSEVLAGRAYGNALPSIPFVTWPHRISLLFGFAGSGDHLAGRGDPHGQRARRQPACAFLSVRVPYLLLLRVAWSSNFVRCAAALFCFVSSCCHCRGHDAVAASIY